MRLPDNLTRRRIAVSGEHRLPVCKFRQFAETVARFKRLSTRTGVAGKLPANAGYQPALPGARAEMKSADRQRARRVRYPINLLPAGLSFHSPSLRRKLAIAYSRLSLAIKLALISAGQIASHS